MPEVCPPAPPSDDTPAPEAMIAALRRCGADRLDPVRFCYLEALARRLPTHAGALQELVATRLSAALASYRERFVLAQGEARDRLTDLSGRFPAAADALQELYVAGDFAALYRCAEQSENPAQTSPLAELLHQLAQHPSALAATAEPGAPASGSDADSHAAGELKAVRYFRDTWSKLSVDQQLTQALAQGPENAGPLNSHRLVLNSLRRLRELSPNYLQRFMSHVDALLWLDQANANTPIRKSGLSNDGEKKRKPARAKAR